MTILLLHEEILERVAKIAEAEKLSPEKAVERALVEFAERRGYDLMTGKKR